MPSQITHMIIAKKFIEKHKGLASEIKNQQLFIDANVLPDLLPDKEVTHYGSRAEKKDIIKRNREKVNPEKFRVLNDMSDETNLGYYLHLYVDYQYYNIFLKDYFTGSDLTKSSMDLFKTTLRDNNYITQKYGITNYYSTLGEELDKIMEDWCQGNYKKYGKEFDYVIPYELEDLEKFIDEMSSIKI